MIKLRYPAKCGVCFRALEAGTRAEWNDVRKLAICEGCLRRRPGAPATGVAGRSALAEGSRRRAKQLAKEQQVRERHPILGRLAIALYPERDKGASWAKGGAAEEVLGASLDELSIQGATIPLHDRQIPGSRANIDHLVIAPSGVWVVDTKSYKGLVTRQDRGGWFRVDEHLVVNGREQSKLVEGVHKQVAHVQAALDDASLEMPVHGALCFVGGDWGWRFRPFLIDGVVVTWPRALRAALQCDGPMDEDAREWVAVHLASWFKPAS
jgi:hypothetical protein